MNTSDTVVQLLTFKLDEQEYALSIDHVVQVARMVALTCPPKAPECVAGVVNLHGRIVPVVDMRRLCGLATKPYDLTTQLLIVRANDRLLALMVDAVQAVLTLPARSLALPESIALATKYLSAVGQMGDRLLLILDPATLLNEAGALDFDVASGQRHAA